MSDQERVIISSMEQRVMQPWSKQKKRNPKRIRRIGVSVCAAAICLAAGTALIGQNADSVNVMNYIETGFEYDETIGRLQYVSNILPQSAMVFLSQSEEKPVFSRPASSQVTHMWSQDEPWIEFDGTSDVQVCQSGEVAVVVKNRNNEYTVRVIHDDGYESVYSGLSSVSVNENDLLDMDEQIGHSQSKTSFELRKDGISIIPVFSEQ